MITVLKKILAAIVLIISTIGFMTDNHNLLEYMLLFSSFLMLTIGVEGFQKGIKAYGYMGLVIFAFLLCVSLQGLFFH
ncbi:DUF3953 domain-containing protein [Halobacillus yeomjeoni]|uniref:DUF3953 domain-containing protein n=1 Tax=Halobacillus yeomjeoni TaxID=311194 RepID=UPI001CD205D0|nr:DUF3953 domain-containing protein [Halobacillus yeomjeoni]MCA0983499.1 DUF3953 domain-containing protein [Halobacillus yeomjeoni]